MRCTARLADTQAVIAIMLAEVPAAYRDYAEVFSEKAANELPKHRLQDYAIDLYAGA